MGPSPQDAAREEMLAIIQRSAGEYQASLDRFFAAGGSRDDLAKIGRLRRRGCRRDRGKTTHDEKSRIRWGVTIVSPRVESFFFFFFWRSNQKDLGLRSLASCLHSY